MNKQVLRYYEFGPFRLSVSEKLLQRDGKSLPLSPKLVDTLLVLVESSGHVVTKEELMAILWPDSFVEESSLTQNISLLRKALAENCDAHCDVHYIETIPKRGYRFMADVRETNGLQIESAISEPTGTQPIIDAQLAESPRQATGTAELSYIRRTVSRKLIRNIAILAACLVLTSVAAFSFFTRNPPVKDPFVPKTIAVLPFKTIGTQGDSELVGLGMANALILRLTQLNRTTILPTSSVFKYANREKDVLAIGRELGVEAVLDGTLQRDGDRVRVTAILIRLSDAKPIWSGNFEETHKDIFALQESASNLLASALVRRIDEPDSHNLRHRPTENPDAYRAYMSGFYFWNKRGTENLRKAISYFEEAVERDPEFALAHALLGDCYYLNGVGDLGIVPRSESLNRAYSAASKALALDTNSAEAHTVKAGLSIINSDFGPAECAFKEALKSNPKYAVAHLRYGYLLFGQAKLQEASAHMQQAVELDPISPVCNAAHAFLLFMSRDYDRAIVADKKALELQPDFIEARANLALALAIKGQFRESLAEIEKLRDSAPLSAALTEIYTLGFSGQTPVARRKLSQLQLSANAPQITAFDYAVLYAAVGDKDKAFEWLEKIDIKGFGRLKFAPELDLLRADVRFAQFLSRFQTRPPFGPKES